MPSLAICCHTAERFLTKGADTRSVASRFGVVIALAVLAVTAAPGSTARDSSPFPSAWIALPIPLRSSGWNPELFRIRTDGTRLHKMTEGPGIVKDPSFAPNGKRLVFARFGSGIFTIGLDGSGLRRLTRLAEDAHPVYSPDGKRIAFIRGDTPWVMRSDGRSQHSLRRAPSLRGRPSWSPDGRKLVLAGGAYAEVFLYTLDARTGRVLKRMLLIDGDLALGFTDVLLAPNGRTVVFGAYRPPPPECLGLQCEVYALYRRPLAGDIASTRVVCNDCDAAAWSADSRVLLIARLGGRLELRVVRNGRTRVVDLHGNMLGGVAALQPR